MRAARPSSVRRVGRQELVGLVVGHRAVGEEGEQRRAAVGHARRARLGLRDLACARGLRARAAPGAALGRGVAGTGCAVFGEASSERRLRRT